MYYMLLMVAETVAIRQVKQLEATIKWLRPTKWRKVVPNPNSVFADIKAIHRAQVQARRLDSKEEEEKSESESESEDDRVEDYIVPERESIKVGGQSNPYILSVVKNKGWFKNTPLDL